MTREEKDKVIQFAVDIIETAQHYELTEFISHINALPVKYPFNPDWPPDEAIRETIRERDDALKEVARLTARLAKAGNVIYNMIGMAVSAFISGYYYGRRQ